MRSAIALGCIASGNGAALLVQREMERGRLDSQYSVLRAAILKAVDYRSDEDSRAAEEARSSPAVHRVDQPTPLSLGMIAFPQSPLPFRPAKRSTHVAWALTTLFLRSSGQCNTDPAIRTGMLVRRLRKSRLLQISQAAADRRSVFFFRHLALVPAHDKLGSGPERLTAWCCELSMPAKMAGHRPIMCHMYHLSGDALRRGMPNTM